jgi:hypothetical protein
VEQHKTEALEGFTKRYAARRRALALYRGTRHMRLDRRFIRSA